MKYDVRKNEKVLVAMDFRNVETTLNEVAGDAFKDYSILLETVVDGRECVGAFAYDSLMTSNGHDTCQYVHDMIRDAGFTLKLSRAPSKMDKQGHVDVYMALHIFRFVEENDVDVVELITGDSDLFPLVEELQHMNIRVRASSFRGNLAQTYKVFADDILLLDSIPMIEMSAPSEEVDSAIADAVVSEPEVTV